MRLLKSLMVLFACVHCSVSVGLTDPDKFHNEKSEFKALVFLSAFCPCSRSHVDHLNQLNNRYSDFALFGVVTDQPESREQIERYYNAERFQFPVLEDPSQSLVKKYNALKTPHVVLLQKDKSGQYKRVYEGGVSDKRQFSQSRKKFLAENLAALKKGRPVLYEKGQSLGCYIRRF